MTARQPGCQPAVLTVGVAFLDCLFAGLPSQPRLGDEIFATHFALQPGGGAVITAIGLARLGVSVGIASAVGDDPFGKLVVERLQREGVDTRHVAIVANASTSVTVALTYPTDRALVTHWSLGIDAVLARPDVLVATAERHVHVVGFSADIADLLARAKRAGLTTSLSVGAQTARSYAGRVDAMLDQIDLFFANEHEAMRLTGCPDLDSALERLARCAPVAIVTRGAAGAVLTAGTERLAAAARPCAVADSTGAGDAFNAGFLAAWLEGRPLAECLAWGNACGAASVQALGGCDGLPFRADLAGVPARAEPPST